ncbi:AAA family ATPase [Endozoicomonas sp. SCSIO W0465]|uniref:AAA family ATPase n=1 Tax=Endozoicomonas sp. SCSIO W0465 TaxID=2918516 RepID=UPI002074C8AA|nr:AAA family ATPase [Endozoicomonas sp. SCSIO W0465]USE37897.1 AAA family ATPase [Endozoicomonas sp. SCSIO W0465]
MFTLSWQFGSEWTQSSPQTFDQTVDALEKQISETSLTKWFLRSVSLVASLEALRISRPYVGDGGAVAITLGTIVLSRVLTHKLLVQPKINRLRQEYRLLSDQLERQQQADSDSLQELRNMSGVENLKAHAEKLQQKMIVRKMRKKAGLKCDDLSRGHMLFTGNPGTGKTMSAQMITHILYELGIIKEDKIVMADRSGLIAKFMGETALKTEQLVNSAKNGVLFIDEAYSLIQPGSAGDFGPEALAKLLLMLEKPEVNTVVIMAGYRKQMEQLMASNPGLRSRIPVKIHFEDYSDEQLIKIFQFMCVKNGYQLAEDAFDVCKEKLSDIQKYEGDHFANARSVRNFFERVQLIQECRLAKEIGEQSDGSHGTPQEDSLTPQGNSSVDPVADDPAADDPAADGVKPLMELSVSDLELAAADYQSQSVSRDSGDWKGMFY